MRNCDTPTANEKKSKTHLDRHNKPRYTKQDTVTKRNGLKVILRHHIRKRMHDKEHLTTEFIVDMITGGIT